MEAWLERLRGEIEDATQELSGDDWSRAPQGRWNIAQILEHLGLSYGATAKSIELKLAAGSPPQMRAAKFPEWLVRIAVLRLGYFPSGRKAPEFVTPRGEGSPDSLARTLGGLERMKVALAAAEERWGGREAVGTHFALGPMNPEQWRKFHYLHGHHHARQIQERLGRKAVG